MTQPDADQAADAYESNYPDKFRPHIGDAYRAGWAAAVEAAAGVVEAEKADSLPKWEQTGHPSWGGRAGAAVDILARIRTLLAPPG